MWSAPVTPPADVKAPPTSTPPDDAASAYTTPFTVERFGTSLPKLRQLVPSQRPTLSALFAPRIQGKSPPTYTNPPDTTMEYTTTQRSEQRKKGFPSSVHRCPFHRASAP